MGSVDRGDLRVSVDAEYSRSPFSSRASAVSAGYAATTRGSAGRLAWPREFVHAANRAQSLA